MHSIVVEVRSEWKIVMAVVLAGVGLGWASAATNAPRPPADHPIRTQLVSFRPKPPSEIDKLRTRNQRLEALVQVLRNREQSR